MLRAGLTYLFTTTVCISLVASAPLPERFSQANRVQRYGNYYDRNLITRPLATFVDREFHQAVVPEYMNNFLPSVRDDHVSNLENRGYFSSEYEDLSIPDETKLDETESTYFKRYDFDVQIHKLQRRGFWDKIKSGFKNASNAVSHSFHKIQSAFGKVHGAIRGGFQRAGRAIRKGFQSAGRAIRKGVQKLRVGIRKVGSSIKKGFNRVGAGLKRAGATMKQGFQKIGQNVQKASGAIKNVGKVTKFGLKVVAAAASIGSKVAKFIPGAGTVVGVALKGAALGANEVSERIPVSLGGQFDKVSESMDYVISPMGSLSKLATSSKGPGGQALALAESLLL